LVGLVDIKQPKNAQSVLAMFNNNFISFIPNAFKKKSQTQAQVTTETSKTLRIIEQNENVKEKCKENSVLYKNELSCYFFNTAGSMILHLFIYVFIKLVLLIIIYGFLKSRVPEYKAKYVGKSKQKRSSLKNGEKLDQKTNKIDTKNDQVSLEKSESISENSEKKESCGYTLGYILYVIHWNTNIKFLFMIVAVFQIDFLISGFTNLRFLNLSSGFGIISFIFSILTIGFIAFLILLSFLKLRQIINLKDSIKLDYEKQGKSFSEKETQENVQEELKEKISEKPELELWQFLIENLEVGLSGAWMNAIVFFNAKEFLQVLFIVIFIGNTYIQLIPCIILGVLHLGILLWKRPYEGILRNILNSITEACVLALFVVFLALHIKRHTITEKESTQIGKLIIAFVILIIVRCIVDLVIGIIELIKVIRANCCQKKKQEKNSAQVIANKN
jgi:hypothetical protein